MLELVLNLLAVVGVVYGALNYRNSNQELQNIRQQQKDLQESEHLIVKPEKGDPIQLKQLTKQKEAVKVVLDVPASHIYNMSQQTFTRTYNDFRIGQIGTIYFSPFRHSFMEGEAGGQFTVKYRRDKVKVDIRQCNISSDLLVKNDPVKLQIIKGYEPKFQSTTFNFKTGCNLVIAGVLSYSI